MREWTLRKDGCSNTITTVTKDNYVVEVNTPETVFSAAMRGRYDENGKVGQQVETRLDEVANAITTVSKDSMVIECKNIR